MQAVCWCRRRRTYEEISVGRIAENSNLSLGFGPFRRSRARFWLPGVVAIWADFEIFERLGGAGDNSYI